MKYSDDIKARAIALLASGKTYLTVSAETGISVTTLRSWGEGVIPPRKVDGTDKDGLPQQAIALLQSGKTYLEVAKETGVNISTLQSWARGVIPPRKAHGADNEDLPQLKAIAIRLYRDEGKTLEYVAEQVGRSGECVRKWLKQAKIPRRKKMKTALVLSVPISPELKEIPEDERSGFCLNVIAKALQK